MGYNDILRTTLYNLRWYSSLDASEKEWAKQWIKQILNEVLIEQYYSHDSRRS